MPHLGIDSSVGLLLYIGAIAAFLLSVFWRADIGLYVLIPLLPLQTIRYRLHGYFLGDQFIDVLLLGVILGLRRQGLPIFPKTPLKWLLLLYIGFTYLSLIRGSFFLGTPLPLWFSDPRVSEWKNYVVDLSVMFFVTTSAIRTKRQMGLLILVMSAGCLLLAKGFHNTVVDRDFSAFSYDLRGAGPMGGAGVNGLAAFVAQVSIFLTGLWLVERRPLPKLGYLAPIAACVYCLIFALSRGGYAAFLIGMIYLGSVRNRLLLGGLAIFLCVWETLVPTAVRERIFMTRDDNGQVEASAATRLTLWEEAIQVFEADPILGTGFNTYAYGSHAEGLRDTHNVFVKVLVETGPAGLLLFLGIFGKLFQIGFRLHRTATDPFFASIGLGFSGFMLAAFVANLFGDRWMYFQITGYTYAFAAMAVRAQQNTLEAAAATVDEADATAAVVPA